MKIEFELPGLPKTTNSGGRTHWAVKVAEARKWKKMVWLAVRASAFMGLPLDKAKLTLARCSSSEPDFDGLVSSFKHVIDGLVEAGVLRNDKPSVIGQPVYQWEKRPPRKGSVRVCVESILTNAIAVPLSERQKNDAECVNKNDALKTDLLNSSCVLNRSSNRS